MKRSLIAVLLSASLFSLGLLGLAQRSTDRARAPSPAPAGKITVPCPATLNDINDCPDTGCGSVDPHLNHQKNIRSDGQAAEPMTIQEMRNLPDPQTAYGCIQFVGRTAVAAGSAMAQTS
jgi:hypothetical protein